MNPDPVQVQPNTTKFISNIDSGWNVYMVIGGYGQNTVLDMVVTNGDITNNCYSRNIGTSISTSYRVIEAHKLYLTSSDITYVSVIRLSPS